MINHAITWLFTSVWGAAICGGVVGCGLNAAATTQNRWLEHTEATK